MNKRYAYILLTIFILLSFTLITTVSYSLWKNNLESDYTQIVNVGCFDIDYNTNSNIFLENTYPMSDEDGLRRIPFRFTITNQTCNIDSIYSVILNTFEDDIEDSWLKVAYQIGDNSISTPKLLSNYEEGISYDDESISEYTITVGKLKVGSSITVKVWIWLDESVGNIAQGASLEAKIFIDNKATSFGTDFLIAKANEETVNYTDSEANKSEMFKFVHETTEQVIISNQLTDYRFIGGGSYCTYTNGIDEYNLASNLDGTCNVVEGYESTFVELPKVNNYIKFNCDEDGNNCEMWRIIGIFTDEDGNQNIKIIYDDNDIVSRYDSKYGSDTYFVGSSNVNSGSNDWTDAQLMYALNSNFISDNNSDFLKVNYIDSTRVYNLNNNLIKDNNNNVIYELFKIPSRVDNGNTIYTSDVDFPWILKSNNIKFLDKVTYYLGSINRTSTVSADNFYNDERSFNVTGDGELTYPRSFNWKGYVGLMYPSDYGYTYGKLVNETFFNNLTLTNNLYSTSWMNFGSSNTSWTLSSNLNAYSTNSFIENDRTIILLKYAHNVGGVKPVVYLNSWIRLVGEGTEEFPYQIF